MPEPGSAARRRHPTADRHQPTPLQVRSLAKMGYSKGLAHWCLARKGLSRHSRRGGLGTRRLRRMGRTLRRTGCSVCRAFRLGLKALEGRMPAVPAASPPARPTSSLQVSALPALWSVLAEQPLASLMSPSQVLSRPELAPVPMEHPRVARMSAFRLVKPCHLSPVREKVGRVGQLLCLPSSPPDR